MEDSKISQNKNGNGSPSVIFGRFDFNTSSTIELTDKMHDELNGVQESQGKQGRVTNPNGTSDIGAILHVIKSSLGTGVLASAEGFKNSGYIVGIIGTMIVGVLCTHCTHIMVKCSQLMCVQNKKDSLGFGETVDAAVKNCSNKTFRKFHRLARVSADGFMFFTYYGVNTIYLLLVSKTFKQIIENHTDLEYDIRVYILIFAIPTYLVGMIRSMKYLVPFSALANLCLLSGLCLTIYFLVQDVPPISTRVPVAPIDRWPAFIATVLFGMEGIGTMLPIESSMRKRTHFLGCPGVLNIAMATVVTFFMLVGLLGYLKYGDLADGSITLNLPQDVFAEIVKGLVGLAILFSYGLQLTAAIDVVWRSVETRLDQKHITRSYYVIRAVMILGTVIIAAAVPNLGPIISLVGAVGFSTCGLFYPVITETALLMNTGFGRLKWKLIKNVVLAVVSIVAAISGCIISVSDIVEQYGIK